MSTNKTEHYGLHAWEPGDDFVRAEFNENFAKLDAALASLAQGLGDKLELVTGSYTGDGKSYHSIPLGFRPRLVMILSGQGLPYYASDMYHQVGGFFLSGMSQSHCSLYSDSFTVYVADSDHYSLNDAGNTYYYAVLR